MEEKCCICGSRLVNQNSCDYYCEVCKEKYEEYDNIPALEPILKRKKYDDER